MDCLSYEDLAHALVDPEERESALEHVRGGCEPCSLRWQLLLALEEARAAGPFPGVPPELSRWAREVPQRAAEAASIAAASEAGAARGALVRIREYLGDLVYDSLGRDGRPQAETAPALRGGPPAGRHLLFEAGPYEFDLSVVEPDSLVGQLVAADEDAPSLTDAVCVLEGGEPLRQTALEEHGDFCFEGVRPGRYTLVVEGEGVRVVLREVDLTDPDAPLPKA